MVFEQRKITMGKGKIQPVYIDVWGDGDSTVDPIGELREIQNRLYKLDNPYVGNKRGILVDIAQALESNGVVFEQVLDLFSGSGVVSTFFKLMGKTVASNDLLTSSYYNALVFSENNGVKLSAEELEFLCKNNNPNKGRFIQSNYSKRFTPEEALFLDNYRANVDTLVEKWEKYFADDLTKNGAAKRIPEIYKAAAIVTIEHYVLNRCFLGGRLNKGQVLAELEHRIAHDRNDGNNMSFRLDQLPNFFHDEDMGCRAYNLDAIEAAKQMRVDYPGIQLAYADPPYGGQQSDYTQMFSFCEEYVYGKEIGSLPHLDVCKKFVTKKDYENNFREVLDAISWVPTWAISYNATSFKDIDGIKSLIGDYRKDIKLIDIDHEYRYRKERGKASEYLIIAR